MIKHIRAAGAWLSRNVLGYGQQENKITKIQVSEWDRLDIEDKISRAETDLEISLILKCIDLHYKHYRYPEDKERMIQLCLQRQYQIDAERRGEYPIMGQDVLWESQVS